MLRLEFVLGRKEGDFFEVGGGLVDSMFEEQLIDKEHLDIAHQSQQVLLIGGKVVEVILQQEQVRISTDIEEEVIRLKLLIDRFRALNKVQRANSMQQANEHIIEH